LDRLGSADPPGVADGGFARECGGHHPLRRVVGTGGNHAWGWDPFETYAFALQINPGVPWIPLDELVADPKCQSTKFVPPDQLGLVFRREFEHDLGHPVVAESVLGSEPREVRIVHSRRG